MRAVPKFTLILVSLLLALATFAWYSSAIAAQALPPRAPLSPPVELTPERVTFLPSASSPPPEESQLQDIPIEPDLLRALAEAEPDEYLRVIVHLREQADVEAAAGGALGVAEVRTQLVSALQATASRSQASLRSYLEEAQTTDLVDAYTPFWIFNGIAVRARPAAIRALAARPEIAVLRLDHYRQWLASDQPAASARLSASSVEWGVAQIRADEVWNSLHISGTGAVVAGMDTGVDWIHPALEANYRGYNPHGPSNHTYSWYDAVGSALYPTDDHGHGSHTMGTAVGQGGIGVAPGARWIAVKVLDKYGYGYDSWIHAGFQWIVAPGGNSAKAPDVVNCSWGSDAGYLTKFQPDLQALRAASILAVFSNGNNGPSEGTVGSPASLPEAFAVGATDPEDDVANFSSRGPSPWGEIRPHVAAPGVSVRSSLPGGMYGSKNGTSMAAPHVSGIVALLRSVSPTLSITRTSFVITSTATPLGAPIPNNDSGWGRVDAFAAVASLAHPGFITGTVVRAGDIAPIAGATVEAVAIMGEGGGMATTDGAGHYLLALAPSVYNLTASAFGYQADTASVVEAITDTTTVVTFSLAALPHGTLSGYITDTFTGDPVTATITVLDTPVEVTASVYTFTLPEGDYTVRVRNLGYRVVTASVHITAGQATTASFALTPAPTILLVDSGRWYDDSQVGYFRQALDDLAYAYDEWGIKDLPDDIPTAGDLASYDIVVWSAPQDAPGFTGAEDAVVGYLDGGGRLFLSGQDVGYLDGGGAGMSFALYYWDYLKVYLVRDNANVWALEGTPDDLFAGLAITITGPDGADNQYFPDEIGILDPDAVAPVFAYRGDGCGGVRIGTCLDYRTIYLSFGFEAINNRAARREVMDRSLEWLVADPPAAGLQLTPVAQDRVGSPGTAVTYTLRVRHLGQGGTTDTISLTLDGASWASQLSALSLTLSPCTSATIVVTVTVPLTAAWDARDAVTLTARSSLSPTLFQTATLATKAPAPILLVDDDRFYEQLGKYQVAMDGAGLPYDVWQINTAVGGSIDKSPSAGVLQQYPIVVWWTGYDWFRPVTAYEEQELAAYLDGGGRLFLSSQDFLYYHRNSPFCRDYLGRLSYREGVALTTTRGVPEDAVGGGLGPWALAFPFPYGPIGGPDTVEPTPGTAISFRNQWRQGIALSRREGGHAAAFFPFPFEALPEEVRPVTMERIVGWLSWLGGSTFAADRGAIPGGGTLTYTVALHNDGPTTVTASLSNTLPASLTLITGSLTGLATYEPFSRTISWEGSLGPGVSLTITYRVTVAATIPSGTSITNTARLGLEEQDIHFHRAAVVRVGRPDLSPSTFGCDPTPALPSAVVTCTLALINGGPGDAAAAVITNPLPSDATFISGSLTLQGGGAVEILTNTVRWTGPLSASSRITVTYRLTLPASPIHPPLYSAAFLDDGTGAWWERPTWLLVEPLRYYFPLVFKDG